MSKPKLPSLRNVSKIVINRIAVWDLDACCEGDPVWRKTAGGPGFNADDAAGTRRATKLPAEMRTKVNTILTRKHRVPLFSNKDIEIFREETAYRWWISGTTLNIVQRLYGKELLIADMERIAKTDKYVPWDQAKKELGLGNGDE